MNKQVIDCLKKFQTIQQEVCKFCCMTRGKEFQLESCKKLNDMKNEAGELKKEMIKFSTWKMFKSISDAL